MLRIMAQPLASDGDVRKALQNAIRLEHATIPPYLTALATLSGDSQSVKYARQVIRDVVVEEMLHMTLACNILNAIGGHPMIADPTFVPTYPHELPMGVAGDLVVHLKRYSKTLIEDTSMKINSRKFHWKFPPSRAASRWRPWRPSPLGSFMQASVPRSLIIPSLFLAIRRFKSRDSLSIREKTSRSPTSSRPSSPSKRS